MSATEWTALTVAAIGALGVALGNVVLQALQMYLSYKRDMSLKEGAARQEKKLDANTAITKAGTVAAATHAEVAAEAATTAAAKTEEISERLNGKLEQKMTEIVKEQMETVHNKVEKLTDYVHQRNHKIDTDLQTVTNKLESVRVMVERQSEKK